MALVMKLSAPVPIPEKAHEAAAQRLPRRKMRMVTEP